MAKGAVQLGSSYQMMVKGGWNFEFDKAGEGHVGRRISCLQRYDFIEAYEKYHNNEVIKYEVERASFFSRVDTWLSENTPVIVNSDSYWCPWSLAYQKRHYLHSFMIYAVCKSDNVIFCYDPYITERRIQVFLDDVYPGFRYCLTLQKKVNTVDPFECLTALKEDIDYLLENESVMFEALFCFADRMKSIDMNIECEEYRNALYAAPILEKLKSVTCSRRGYSYLIQYVAMIYKDSKLDELSKRMYEISGVWEQVRGQLIRSYLREDRQEINKISKKIYNIAEAEMKLANSLYQSVRNRYYEWR